MRKKDKEKVREEMRNFDQNIYLQKRTLCFQEVARKEMEDARKQELLKMSPKPIHGILVNNEPKDPKVKEKRDFVKKVIILE